jgi:hypothetical protein
LITLSNVFDYRLTHLSYVLAHQCGCLLCVAALTGLKDGPMLSLAPGGVARLGLDDKDVQIVLHTVS